MGLNEQNDTESSDNETDSETTATNDTTTTNTTTTEEADVIERILLEDKTQLTSITSQNKTVRRKDYTCRKSK